MVTHGDMNMKKVILRGPSLTQSGYGVHCRQIASWLLSKTDWDVKFQALPWGDTPWILNAAAQNGLIEKIMKNTVDVSGNKDKYDMSFQLQLPNEWDHSLAKYNVGITAGVETDVCNPQWIEACNKMDMIIVPSNHTANCFKKTGDITKPLVVVPEAFCDEIGMQVEKSTIESLPEFSTNFNFLIFGQITGDNPLNDRKNIFYTIKWICEAFSEDPDVGIVVKTNIGRNTNIDKKRTKEMLRSVVKECRKGPFPKIHLLHGDISEKEIAALYKHTQVKALVTLTRGEGYGLPILEAAASGLPVIATGWSGHTDFLQQGKYINISYALKSIHSSRIDNKIFMQNSKWAEANEDDFKKKIIKFKNASTTPSEWASQMSNSIKESHSLRSIFRLYDNALKEQL
jgi:glycosyltransferase involved in cell wall biosynthesis